jgi:hypothetical protein
VAAQQECIVFARARRARRARSEKPKKTVRVEAVKRKKSGGGRGRVSSGW